MPGGCTVDPPQLRLEQVMLLWRHVRFSSARRESLFDPVNDELHRQRGQHHAQQAGQNGSTGRAEKLVEPFGDHQGGEQHHRRRNDDADQRGALHRFIERAGQEDHGGNRAGSCDQGNGKRKHRDIGNVVLGDRPLGAFFLPLMAFFENHLESDVKQQNAAGDAECAERNSQNAENAGAGNSENRIEPVSILEEMQRSYLDYAMSVIVSRALPDVRDGLKPVHRRILYAMHEGGYHWNRKYVKSSRIVGDVMGKYHPHGDAAIYDALVRMAQDWSLRVPLVDGQGNFGSIDGDPPAAMRYTESRLEKVAHELLEDIDKDTVDFQETMMPPAASRLSAGAVPQPAGQWFAGGIAVGMATNIPPHNLSRWSTAAIALIDNPAITLIEMMEIIPGPDFPTGGHHPWPAPAFARPTRPGRGSVVMRGRVRYRAERNGDREAIVITEVPYQVNKASMIEKMAELVRDKRIEGISDMRDESDRQGYRVVVELKRDAVADVSSTSSTATRRCRRHSAPTWWR
jgi:hypothetical protein